MTDEFSLSSLNGQVRDTDKYYNQAHHMMYTYKNKYNVRRPTRETLIVLLCALQSSRIYSNEVEYIII